ncbi:hypothetical protein FVEG_14664 [Fusarium verticillioides 7600]|uniref:Uncharacterized protein n=1 Tax=Gibberella moniliformis (strain M3125 / FGSC 7600) TaxID=334819 RepID=W7LLY0_GIBM7|nr:hypothetical protein FVEG_14664 [Fusarium verticillioides 7600]EWG36409.1 hypothetical protein FVEG_14664 [Fusarium verticillioides 7600]
MCCAAISSFSPDPSHQVRFLKNMQQFSASLMRCGAMRCAAAFVPPSASTYLPASVSLLFSLDRSGIHCLIGVAHHLALGGRCCCGSSLYAVPHASPALHPMSCISSPPAFADRLPLHRRVISSPSSAILTGC